MGRRKIEIRPIKDDRNRSVTFLKRKGGLFKKAYELSVLCSVDVAVIIFGNNKKLYEFSSGDINETISRHHFYGAPHEHKGPNDFAGKGGGDDDEEDDEVAGSPVLGSQSPAGAGRAGMIQHPLQNQPGLQHMRDVTPSASPPMGNGPMPAYPQRVVTPQPNGSRPSSRVSHLRRTSNVGSQHLSTPSQGPPPQPTYAYSPNPQYHPQHAAIMQQQHQPQQQLQQQQQQQYQHHQRSSSQPYPIQPPQYPAYGTSTPQQIAAVQAQQAYLQDQQRRQSVPPSFMNQMQHQGPPPMGSRQPQLQHMAQQQQQQQHQQHHHHHLQQQQSQAQAGATRSIDSTPQPEQGSFQSPPLPQPKPMPAHAKSHSIFTPIDDSRSLLAQHWGGSTSHHSDVAVKLEGPRSQSIDVAAISRGKAKTKDQVPRKPEENAQQAAISAPPQRTASTSSVPGGQGRQAGNGDAKRPRLKVHIPSEQSDAGSTAGDSPKGTSTSAGPTPMRSSQSAVVLPAPSPSTNTIMSAGATGPPNPFARPPPPMSTNPHVNRERDSIETPMSALPSRVMDGNQMLPSPSSFWPDMWFKDNNMMPSPLNFQTPVALKGPGFDEEDRKRKAEEDNGGGGKRPKT